MKKQYAVLGLGTFGTSVALTLQSLGCEVMAVDRSMERVQNIADSVSYAMCADIEAPSVMDSLGAGNLDGVIVIQYYGHDAGEGVRDALRDGESA